MRVSCILSVGSVAGQKVEKADQDVYVDVKIQIVSSVGSDYPMTGLLHFV